MEQKDKSGIQKDIDRLLERHLFDSLSIERFIKGDRALDIGSGGGFQEFLLAICRPDLHFTLLDRSAKRVRFLRVVQAELGLDNVDCVCQNLPVSSAMNNTYDVAFARAVSDPSTMWGISEQLLKSKGRLIFFSCLLSLTIRREKENYKKEVRRH